MKKLLTQEEVFKDCWIDPTEEYTDFYNKGEPKGKMVQVEITGVPVEAHDMLWKILAKSELDKYIDYAFNNDGVLFVRYFEEE